MDSWAEAGGVSFVSATSVDAHCCALSPCGRWPFPPSNHTLHSGEGVLSPHLPCRDKPLNPPFASRSQPSSHKGRGKRRRARFVSEASLHEHPPSSSSSLVNGLVVGTLYGVVGNVVCADLQGEHRSSTFAQGRSCCWSGRLGVLDACWQKYQVPFWIGMPMTLVFMFVFGNRDPGPRSSGR